MRVIGRTKSCAVSVVIPTFNRAHLLPVAIQSVRSQTIADIEIIVVDDGSTDATASVVEGISDPLVRSLRHSVNRGAAAARNTGISVARGRHIAFLDSDDMWLPHKLERQLACLEAAPDLRVLCSGFEQVLPGNRRVLRSSFKSRLSQSDLSLGCRCAPGSTLVVEASVFDEVGLFDETLRRLEDWDWLLRCAGHGPVGVIEDVLAVVCVSPRPRRLYFDVLKAVERMENNWIESTRLSCSRDRHALAATLRNELAAVAYGEGDMGRAAWHLIISLYHLPGRETEFFKRILYRVFCDVCYALGRDKSPAVGATSVPPPANGRLSTRCERRDTMME